MNDLPIRLRPATQEDVPFIFDSWLKSYRSSTFARFVPKTIYYSEHHKVLERLMKRCSVILAVNNQDPSQIYGFICAEVVENIFCIHYVYVKQSFRHLGIGKTLVKALYPDIGKDASVYTHHTTPATSLAPRYQCVYHPYIYINDSEDFNKNTQKEEPRVETENTLESSENIPDKVQENNSPQEPVNE